MDHKGQKNWKYRRKVFWEGSPCIIFWTAHKKLNCKYYLPLFMNTNPF